MLINVVIIYLIQSTFAIFHHKPLPHTRIHVCLTPPNTMLKVQKHITECQNEVKSNIFHEAFSLIHEAAFHHPEDHTHIEYKPKGEHDEFANHNFSLTEQEILKFFENHAHPSHHVGPSSGHLGSSGEVSHDHLHDPSHPSKHSLGYSDHPHILDATSHHSHDNSHGWQQPYPVNFHKKTDAIQLNKQPEESSRLLRAITSTRDPYTYFDVNTGDAVKNLEQPTQDKSDIFFDHHHDLHHHDSHDHHDLHDHHDSHDHHDPHDHHSDVHPTTATFKDKRIAGCLMHCLYEKDHAIDVHTGFPTLDGLVNFYSDGVHEHGFFMTTLRAVDFCLKGASKKYHINRHIKPSAGISCDLAFDIFDCVSDRITEYCSKHHYHDEHSVKGHHQTYWGHAVDDHYTEEYHDDATYYY